MLVIPTFFPIIPDIFYFNLTPIEAVGLRSRWIHIPIKGGQK
jgi:hypothetical protein